LHFCTSIKRHVIQKKISRALVSVFYKDNLDPIIHYLAKQGVEFVSTGGTQEFIEKLGYAVTPVEKLTGLSFHFWWSGKNIAPSSFWGYSF
jgi:phosphoribosylaminoimidazolecarboxamide formyltransferase/IMP cyclohydrolase